MLLVDKIQSSLKNLKTCISNFWKWKKIICQDRWWDYYFLLIILRFKLNDMYCHWGKNTHYYGDYDHKEILKNIIKDLDYLIEADDLENSEEYTRISKRFWSKLGRHYQKFWD